MNEERVLKRSDEGRMLTGVCAGLGRYTGMDPVIFRVGFAVLVVGSGIGIMLYIAAFLLMRNTNGGPGYAEQWSRRVFDAETVMALLAAIFGLGLIINLAADGISTATVVVGTLLAIALLAAHSQGVDLLALTRSLPERIKGRRGTRPVPDHWAGEPFGARPFPPAAPPFSSAPPAGVPFPSGGRFSPPPTSASFPSSPPAPPSSAPPAAAPTCVPSTPPAGAPTAAPTGAPSAAPTGVPTAASPAGAPPQDRADVTHTEAPPADAVSGAGTEYRRLADLAREARAAHQDAPSTSSTSPASSGYGRPGYGAAGAPVAPRYGTGRFGGGGFDSSGEPFAPRGPYRPHDAHPPYEPQYWGYDKRGGTRPARPDRPKSFIGALTVFIAFMVGGIMVAAQSSSTTFNLPVVGGVVLITIGAGLLVATWFGRGAGLVATGTIVALLLVAGSTMNGIPKKIGSYTWEPVDSSQAVRTYSVGIGDGTLDLRSTKLLPGSRTRFDASVSIGELKIIVPRTARVEVFGYTRLGDVKIEHTVQGGADVHHDKVLEPDVKPSGSVPVIELHVKAGIGDVEVHRAA